jgi:hypothetical protein
MSLVVHERVGGDAEEVVDRGGEVAWVAGMVGRVGGDAVGGAEDGAGAGAAAGHGDRINPGPVVAAPAPVSESLRSDPVRPLLAEALARWQAAGVDTSALHGIDVRIADLLLGHDHEADGVMQDTLTAGTRRTVSPVLATDTDELSVALTGFESNEETPWMGGRQFGRGSKR